MVGTLAVVLFSLLALGPRASQGQHLLFNVC